MHSSLFSVRNAASATVSCACVRQSSSGVQLFAFERRLYVPSVDAAHCAHSAFSWTTTRKPAARGLSSSTLVRNLPATLLLRWRSLPICRSIREQSAGWGRMPGRSSRAARRYQSSATCSSLEASQNLATTLINAQVCPPDLPGSFCNNLAVELVELKGLPQQPAQPDVAEAPAALQRYVPRTHSSQIGGSLSFEGVRLVGSLASVSAALSGPFVHSCRRYPARGSSRTAPHPG